jgi:hypothetical protein
MRLHIFFFLVILIEIFILKTTMYHKYTLKYQKFTKKKIKKRYYRLCFALNIGVLRYVFFFKESCRLTGSVVLRVELDHDLGASVLVHYGPLQIFVCWRELCVMATPFGCSTSESRCDFVPPQRGVGCGEPFFAEFQEILWVLVVEAGKF